MKKKTLITICAFVLVIALSVAGTVAYLTDKTDSITNTFTVGNVKIELAETKPTNNTAKMVPGSTIDKDPVVTVKADSEKCYLFVKIDESNSLDTFIAYSVATGWTELQSGVYYRVVESSNAAQPFNVLTNNKVSVKNVSQTDMDGITASTTAAPTLTFKAYAIQFENVVASGTQTAEQVAWGLVNA